ncbi:hypothetical protein Hanom_Chr09g00762501 [Helianthus anomalus]
MSHSAIFSCPSSPNCLARYIILRGSDLSTSEQSNSHCAFLLLNFSYCFGSGSIDSSVGVEQS